MRPFALPVLMLAVLAVLGCGGGSTLPGGLVLTWNSNGTSGNQYQTLHLLAGANATITTTQNGTRQSFTVFLSGGEPNGSAPGAGPISASSPCTAFALDANATTAQPSHTVTGVSAGTCYLVAEDTQLAYTQLLLSNP